MNTVNEELTWLISNYAYQGTPQWVPPGNSNEDPAQHWTWCGWSLGHSHGSTPTWPQSSAGRVYSGAGPSHSCSVLPARIPRLRGPQTPGWGSRKRRHGQAPHHGHCLGLPQVRPFHCKRCSHSLVHVHAIDLVKCLEPLTSRGIAPI